ncbi:MAG: RDD family protein [Pseudomonadota bacterium]
MHYPRLLRRIRALLIDSMILLVIVIVCFLLAGIFDAGSKLLRASIAFIPVIIYEPLFVSLRGATIGHQIMGIEIVSAKSMRKLNIVVSFIRSFFKFIFGLPSLYFVLTTKKHQALHDIFSGALVVIKSGTALPSSEKLDIRTESSEYIYPSKLRRVGITISYVLFAFIILTILFGLLMSADCVENGRCSSQEKSFSVLVNLFFLIFIGYLVVAGWRARLYGCRRKKLPAEVIHTEQNEAGLS